MAQSENGQDGSGVPSWFMIFFVPLFAVLIVLLLIPFTQRLPVDSVIGDKTDPLEVFNQTQTSLVSTQRQMKTFDQYFDSFRTDGESSNLLDSDYTISSPRLEYNYSFYEGRREFYDRCTSKVTNINFTKPKASYFSFNYENRTFEYEINVYPQLYFFTDQLKTQDCYFSEDQYSQGYLEDPYNNNFVRALAQDFMLLRDQGYSDDEIVEIATLFVQSIPYGTDKTQLNRYPYETIYETEGNCLDKSVILAGILQELGYESYFILGQAKQYHALVGIVCEDGNVEHEGKELCFAETTVYTPIGSDVEITIEEIIPSSTGTQVYRGAHYGPQVVTFFDSQHAQRKVMENRLDIINNDLDSIQRAMCQTDCVYCVGNEVDFTRSSEEITTCDDALEYNDLVADYNSNVNEYNELISDWYKIYYSLESAMFNNVKLLRKT